MNFSQVIIENEQSIRLWVFLGGLTVFFLIGVILPFRQVSTKEMAQRWLHNTALTFFNSTLLKLILPIGLVALAQQYSKLGLLNQFDGYFMIKVLFAIVFLDFAIYWQHRVFHLIPVFWRLHRVHHTDTEYDVTTALRFHTFEIFLSYAIKCALVLIMGIPAVAIIIFEVLLNFCAMFNHGNYALPKLLEKPVRSLIVTPSMHRVHHSVVNHETNSNYGFCLSIWDRMFGSYIEEPSNDPLTMDIGIESFRDRSEQRLDKLLIQPFSKS